MQRVFRFFSSCNQKNENDYELAFRSVDDNNGFDEDNSEENIEDQDYHSDYIGDELKDSIGCSNTVCCCGFCFCIPLFTLLGMEGGCGLAIYLQPILMKAYGVNTASFVSTGLPMTTTIGGVAAGFLGWGQVTQKAEEWESKQKGQNKSYSVYAFFNSLFSCNKRDGSDNTADNHSAEHLIIDIDDNNTTVNSAYRR